MVNFGGFTQSSPRHKVTTDRHPSDFQSISSQWVPRRCFSAAWLQLYSWQYRNLITANMCIRNSRYLSTAAPVGMLRANPLTPVRRKYGMHSILFAITARESDGVTKNAFSPKIMFRSFFEDKYELILKNTQFYFSVYLLHLHQRQLQARNLRPS